MNNSTVLTIGSGLSENLGLQLYSLLLSNNGVLSVYDKNANIVWSYPYYD